METVRFYSKKELEQFISKRLGEEKLGQAVTTVTNWDALKNSPSKYVLLGIPEDIGVRANHGKPGARDAWLTALQSFCNIQNNAFTQAENLIVLGEIDCKTQMEQAENIGQDDPHYFEKLGELVTQIDDKVSKTIKQIVQANKIPIIIGGGHNNSFGNLKGTSQAIGKPINCVNFDAHTDFRALEHRHSGNGFSYAFEDGFLNKYSIFGIHRNYTSKAVFETMDTNPKRIQYSIFEEIAISKKISFSKALQNAEAFINTKTEYFGVELDLDAIEHMGSSAMTPSGFTLTEARKFIRYFSEKENCKYIHICEGAPSFSANPNQLGKAISYLISDCIAS
ncbi:formimidoylglutamase [Marixanthomonas spongiae]|uniref:Arginase n=1 Tax=Marixanthomonas spongiae TaxID=2174845 RepID=A0A2U0I5I8_9FLAO|nr:formimidoylglutamase [Marixanthomonas spongiae]PVW16375.1 arginase [Marixanthomonas spongiae]